MRLFYFTLPLAVVMAGTGVWLLTSASRFVPTNSPNNGTEPRHPVTPDMSAGATALAKKIAPDFSLPDSRSQIHTLSELTKDKPLYIYFILDGCPCSTDAEPLFHKLWERYKNQINFVGVIGSDQKTAAQWQKDHQMPYTILADPQLKVIHAYDARHSVYNALVTRDQRIDKMWPGYSHDMLIEVNSHMASLLGIPEQPFDPLYAPLKLSSGCVYPAAQ